MTLTPISLTPPTIPRDLFPTAVERPEPSIILNIESPESSVHRAKIYWLNYARNLTTSRHEFAEYINGIAKIALSKLDELSLKGCPSKQLALEASKAIDQLNSSARRFLESRQLYKQQKQEADDGLNKIQMEIKSIDFRFERFTLTEPVKSFSTPTHPVHSSISHDEGHSASYVGDWGTGEVAHQIQKKSKTKGKVKAVAFEVLSNTLRGHAPEDSTDPIRDRVSSAAAHVLMSEVIHHLTHKIKPHSILSGADAAHNLSHRLESNLASLKNKEEIAYYWDRQWIQTGEGCSFASSLGQAQAFLNLAQVPARVIHAIHHGICSTIGMGCDLAGLTDENIAIVTKAMLEFIARNSPDLLEERAWATVTEDMSIGE